MVASRRTLALLVAGVLVLGTVWALWPRPARRLPASGGSAGTTVVFLGDSITHGHRLAQEAAFPYRLGQALGVRAINAGISGDTTEGGLRRIERDVLAHRPQVVVVALGVNDAFRQAPREATVANLRAITQRIRAQGAVVVLLHTAVPHVAGDGNRGSSARSPGPRTRYWSRTSSRAWCPSTRTTGFTLTRRARRCWPNGSCPSCVRPSAAPDAGNQGRRGR